jgi:hypothetical protein
MSSFVVTPHPGIPTRPSSRHSRHADERDRAAAPPAAARARRPAPSHRAARADRTADRTRAHARRRRPGASSHAHDPVRGGEPRIAQPREPCERALPRSGRDARAHVASRTTCTRLPLRLRDAPNSWPSTVPRPTRATTHADARRPTDGGLSMPRGASRAGRAAAAGAAEPRPPGAPRAPIAAGHGGPLVVFSRVAGGDRLTALDSTRDPCALPQRRASPAPSDSRCAAWHLI